MRRMFSEKQIKEMISAGAQSEIAEALEGDIEIGGDLSVTGDLEVTGDVQANTLKQSEANYSVDLHEAFSSGNYSTYFKSDTAYMRFEEINGVLWFIISGLFIAQEVSGTNASFEFIIPNEFKTKYYDKIYRADGTNLTQEVSSSADIVVNSMATQIGGTINVRAFKLTCLTSSANPNLAITIISYGNTAEDANVKLDIRIPITIL